MKLPFTISFQNKVFIALLLLVNIPVFLTGYMAKSLLEGNLLEAKKDKLMSIARVLHSHLGPAGYEALLRQAGVEFASREQKIAALNQALGPFTDDVGASSPSLGIGFYSRELDAILTYGPSSSFGHMVGVSIAPEHPGRIVMAENHPMAAFGSMVRGDILNAMLPIERGGQVIGYIWANELTTDISAQIAAMTREITVIMLCCFSLAFVALALLSRRTVRAVDQIISGVRAMRQDLSASIVVPKGELGEVAASINVMARDIGKANAEKDRAISVLEGVLNNVDVALYVCDPTTKQLVYCNRYLLSMGKGRQAAGRLCFETLYDRTEPCAFCPQQKLLDADGNQAVPAVHWETRTADGREFLVTDRMITWYDGRLLHMEVATDVTDRKALVVAEAANIAQRDFLARMSHEIRTPMNGVLGMVRLAMQADPPPVQLEYLKKIQASASLLLGIINDILDFSRIEAGRLEIEPHQFSLYAMVDNIRELIQPGIQDKELDLTVALDASVPEYAYGDGLRLAQILLNLLGNASKFTLAGSISLSMRAFPLLPSDSFRLECEVSDTGIGMAPEQLAGLFLPFSQADSSTSRKFGGTGLGLSISKALTELMGGSISAHSEEGKGSVFSFSVLLGAADADRDGRADEKGALWEAVRYDGRRFLLVEDNEINQEIAVAVLSELGARVDVAGNGQEGLAAFLNEEYDLIFMDVRMPVMDGLEATRHIRRSGKHDAACVPIIAMTANAMQEDREASREAGMDGHIAKPLDMAELKSTLYRLLGKRYA